MVLGLYLNRYRNGEEWTPNHSHKGTKQIVVSFGAMRVLDVGKRQFQMENGDAIIFGSAVHGVPKCIQPETRISLAAFLIPTPEGPLLNMFEAASARASARPKPRIVELDDEEAE